MKLISFLLSVFKLDFKNVIQFNVFNLWRPVDTKAFYFQVCCLGRKNIQLFCLRDESIHIPKRRVCPMKTDRCYLDTLPVSTSTPPSRAPVCSVISVYVCIYQQKWDEKDTTIMIKAILVFNNHGKPRLSKFYQYFVSDTVIMCCCQLSWVVRWWGSFIQKSNKFEYRIF